MDENLPLDIEPEISKIQIGTVFYSVSGFGCANYVVIGLEDEESGCFPVSQTYFNHADEESLTHFTGSFPQHEILRGVFDIWSSERIQDALENGMKKAPRHVPVGFLKSMIPS